MDTVCHRYTCRARIWAKVNVVSNLRGDWLIVPEPELCVR
jgi:hypothetical protein